jgi:hypothetical protein
MPVYPTSRISKGVAIVNDYPYPTGEIDSIIIECYDSIVTMEQFVSNAKDNYSKTPPGYIPKKIVVSI